MRKTAFRFIFSISFLLIFFSSSIAQVSDDSSQITVDATGEVQVRADLIQFRVNITQFNTDARQAFQIHKEQEEYLTELLLEEGIDDSSITANPISISHIRRYNNTGESGYETSQQVTIVMEDVTQFESMQIKLIENGFTNFSGSFTSTQITDASNKALKHAFEQARMKAEILAEAAGKQITDVITINYTSGRIYAARSESMEMSLDATSGSLLRFERTIPVRENISVQFRIE